ncbi:MAG TPA: hypothetical protein VF541_10340 [Longimicrobium sp.]|jgi:hypothetical protein
MHKLKLQLETLVVDTLETGRAGTGLGTVMAHDLYTNNSCVYSCGGSCGPPCATN